MKITTTNLNKHLAIITLFFISCHILASEGPQKSRDQMFTEAFESQKKRIMDLPAYTAAHKRFNEYLHDIEQYKASKIKEMQEDLEYQKNFSDIKKEIQRSGELCKQNSDLSTVEREYLVTALTKQFIPT